MPFGMVNAPATFARLMNLVLEGAKDHSDAYFDDVEIFSISWVEHLQHVRDVLQRLRDAKLTLRPTNCHFGYREVLVVGHVVGNGVIKPNPEKIEAILRIPRPETKSQVRSFLGTVNYYRLFIPECARICQLLTDLTKKGKPFQVH